MLAGFAPLYPPYDWIPACAGMTRRILPHGCAEGPEERDSSHPYPFAEGLGVSPNFSNLPPRVGGQRVESGYGDSVDGFRFSLDSRFRGNDGRECRDSSLPRVWGCPPVSLILPP